MYRRIVSAILIALLTVFGAPDLLKGQLVDSLLYLIDNELVDDDAEKYELLTQVLDSIYDTEKKIRYCDQAIELAQELGIKPADPYHEKGYAYLLSGDYAMALECLMLAATYYEEDGNSGDLGRVYNNIAETYNLQGNFENEKIYIQNALEIYEQIKDSVQLAYTLHNFGYSNYSMGNYDTALVLYKESSDVFKSLDTEYGVMSYFACLGNMGLVYVELSDFNKAEEYLLLAIDTLTSLGVEWYAAEFMIGYASILQHKGEIKQAIDYALRALKTSGNQDHEREASLLLAQLYEISDMIDSAYYYQSLFLISSDSMKNIVQRMAFLRTEYEIGRKQAEVEKTQAELDAVEREKQIRSIVIIGLGVILLLAIWLVAMYYTYLKRSRKLTGALEERGVLLEKQSSELKEKNEKILNTNEELTVLNEAISKQKNEILDSITYAKKIQAAMLPPEQYFHEILNDVFILFKPRDIVSGDFYWIKHVNQYVILAAADCTGHGVPGAFMSLLGISFLDEIVQRREITEANQVLNELRRQIRNSLRQHGQAEESKDGIDMAICVIDEKNNTLQFSGANNPMYLIRENNGTPELTEYKADRMPLGYYQGRFKTFKNQEIQLEYGDVFYLFSDGFLDQKGGKDNKKFMSKKFKDLLIKIHQDPMQEQHDILEKTLSDWMGDNAQIDDILVIGVRV